MSLSSSPSITSQFDNVILELEKITRLVLEVVFVQVDESFLGDGLWNNRERVSYSAQLGQYAQEQDTPTIYSLVACYPHHSG